MRFNFVVSSLTARHVSPRCDLVAVGDDCSVKRTAFYWLMPWLVFSASVGAWAGNLKSLPRADEVVESV